MLSSVLHCMLVMTSAGLAPSAPLGSVVPTTGTAMPPSPLAAITAAVPRAIMTSKQIWKSSLRALRLARYSRLSPIQKLASVPLYFLCTPSGWPYQFNDPDDAHKPAEKRVKMIPYFMAYEDANHFLSNAVNGAARPYQYRLMVTSMQQV
jgi:hypothetical protein